MAQRGVDAKDFGNEYKISYGGKEQRFAWSLEDSELRDLLVAIADNTGDIPSGSLPIFPTVTLTMPGDIAGPYDLSELSGFRWSISISTITTSPIELAIQGRNSATADWFMFNNGSYKFTKIGTYTIAIPEAIAKDMQLSLISGEANIQVVLWAKQ